MPEIKTLEELGVVLTEAEIERAALKATIKTLQDQAEAERVEREVEKADREAKDAQYVEKIKELKIFATSKGTWKEQPTQEAFN